MVRPFDEAANNLVMSNLSHRLEALKCEEMTSTNTRFLRLEKVLSNHRLLYRKFSSLVHHWMEFSFSGPSRFVDEEVSVPPVERDYAPCSNNSSRYIWRSFVT